MKSSVLHNLFFYSEVARVFEDKETILGVNENNEHHLFRKDTGKICFSERQAKESFVASFLNKEFSDKSEVVCV